MGARAITDAERRQLLRRNLTNAAEITEAIKIALEDDILRNKDKAIEMLDELRNCIDSANADVNDVTETWTWTNRGV